MEAPPTLGKSARLGSVSYTHLDVYKRQVLDEVTIAGIVSGDLPVQVKALTSDPEAWQSR